MDFIDGIRRLYVLDGQHLLNGLIRYDEEIPYIIIPIKDEKELVEKIALLNSSSKPWILQDYVTAWASLEKDYIKLNKYHEVHDIEFSILASILGEVSLANGTTISKLIKNGDFRIINEEKGCEIVKNLSECLKNMNRMDRKANRYFALNMLNFTNVSKEYKHLEFLGIWKRIKKS